MNTNLVLFVIAVKGTPVITFILKYQALFKLVNIKQKYYLIIKSKYVIYWPEIFENLGFALSEHCE